MHDIKKGFYVDVGANNPDIDSVTKFFYERGWHGINIEPINSLYKELVKRRGRDININVGVSSTAGTLKLREFTKGLHGWSTFDAELQAERANQPHKDYEVKTAPLSELFAAYKVKTIDFLKIDVEGLEYEVLKSNDWAIYRPKVIMIENSEPRCIAFIEDNGYKNVFYDGLNTYFVEATLEDKHTINDYVSVLLSGQIVINQKEDATQKQLLLTEKVLTQTQKHYNDLETAHKNQTQILETERAHLSRVIDNPAAELGLRRVLKSLTSQIKRKLYK